MNGQNSTTNNSGIDFDEYIGLAKEIINRYEWKPDEAKSLKDRLQRIENKQNDKKLNLSVIGEFSVGKSTFINALLRQQLLSSATLQGTTTVSTVIESAERYSIVLHSKNKRVDRRYYNDAKHLLRGLTDTTSSPKNTKKLEKLTVELKSKSDLLNGIRIIDTPGTNSTEAWHTETTERAIRELSDASIVLIDANRMLPETQIAFIRNNLEDVIHQCIFVLTKIDLVRPRERNMVIEFVKQRLSYLFDIDNPFVIPYSSLHVLDNCGITVDEGIRFVKDEQLLEESFKNETALCEHISAKKAVAQSKKLISLLEEMYANLNEKIENVSGDYEKEKEILERTKSADLNRFVNDQIRSRTLKIRTKGEAVKAAVIAETNTAIREAKDEIYDNINNCTSSDGVSAYINNKFSSDCTALGKEILDKKYEAELRLLDDELSSQIEQFKNDFKRNYEKLGLLAMNEKKVSLSNTLSKTKLDSASSSVASAYVQELTSKENKLFGGGAAAGAAIGTMIAPGIGTILGGFLGAIGGLFFAPDLSEVKAKARSGVSDSMSSYFNKINDATSSAVDTYINDTVDLFTKEAKRYLSTYNDYVNEKIVENRNQKAEIDRKLEKVYADRQKISTAKDRLTKAKKQLK